MTMEIHTIIKPVRLATDDESFTENESEFKMPYLLVC